MRQFFLETNPDQLPAVGETVLLDREESHHLATVLRGGRDDVLHLTDGRGHRVTARAVDPEGRQTRLEILSFTVDVEEADRPHLTLACAVVKGRRFEWVLEKAVELGVHTIVPLITRHGVIDPRQGKQDRWAGLLKAALKQAGRTWLPHLASPMSLDEYLTAESTVWHLFGAVPGELPLELSVPAWTSLLAEPPSPLPNVLSVLVGPEGGWSSGEQEQLLRAEAHPVHLGPHVLRTETAAVAGLCALQALRGAWRAELT